MRGPRRWPQIALGAACAGALASAILFLTVGLNKADQYGGSIAALVAFVTLGLAAYDWAAARLAAPADAVDTAARNLAEAVREQWQREADVRSLRRPTALRVRWSTTERPVQAAGPAGGYRRRGEGGRLTENFRAGERQLVILGEPGAGKTTLALRLVVELLENPEPGEPVPVPLSLSSWDPEVTPSTWIAKRLVEDYPFLTDTRTFGRDIAARLIARGRVMPVLDGLDEMAAGVRARAIEAIVQNLGGEPIVLTCRGAEYEEIADSASRRLARAPVIELEPVGADRAIDYLGMVDGPSSDRWAPVFDHLRADPDGALAQALSTPLMIDLLRTAYTDPGTDPAELLNPELGERGRIEDHLLGALVPSVYSPVHYGRYRADKASTWLMYIAGELRRRRTRDFAPWRLRSPVVALVNGLVIGAGGGLLCAILFGAGAWQVFAGGLCAGLAGVATGMFAGRDSGAELQLRTDHRAVLRTHLVVSALWTVLTGTAVGFLLFVLTGGLGGDSVRARLLGLVFAAVFGLGTGISSSWGAYLLSRGWLAMTGHLPFRLTRFLQDAHERGVLRRTGAVWQFRHARLQDRLAGPMPDPSGTEPAPRLPQWWSAPGLRVAVQMVAILAILGIFMTVGSQVGMVPAGGYRPTLTSEEESGCAQERCPIRSFYTWDLPAGARRTSEFAVHNDADQIPLTGLGGSLMLHGCDGATAEATLSAGGRSLPATRITSTEWSKMPSFRAPWPRGITGFTLAIRRTDTRPCRAELEWDGPGMYRDLLSDLKRNLRGTPS